MSNLAMMMGLGSGAGGGSITLEFITGIGGTYSLTVPSATVQAGDIAVYYDRGATSTVSSHSGWTLVGSYDNVMDDACHVKILEAGDIGATFSRTNNTSYDVSVMGFFRLSSPVSNIHISSVNFPAYTSSVPADQTVTTGDYSPANLIIATYASYTAGVNIDNSPFLSEVYNQNGENNNKIHMYYEIQNDANTDRVISTTMNGGSYNSLTSFCLNFS